MMTFLGINMYEKYEAQSRWLINYRNVYNSLTNTKWWSVVRKTSNGVTQGLVLEQCWSPLYNVSTSDFSDILYTKQWRSKAKCRSSPP